MHVTSIGKGIPKVFSLNYAEIHGVCDLVATVAHAINYARCTGIAQILVFHKDATRVKSLCDKVESVLLGMKMPDEPGLSLRVGKIGPELFRFDIATLKMHDLPEQTQEEE